MAMMIKMIGEILKKKETVEKRCSNKAKGEILTLSNRNHVQDQHHNHLAHRAHLRAHILLLNQVT